MKLHLSILAVVSIATASGSNISRQLSAAECGNGICEKEETCESCPYDCNCAPIRDLASSTYSTCSHNDQICTSISDCNNQGTCDPMRNPPPSFSILGVGDTPYNEYEACMARQEVLLIKKNAGHKFFFHLGDIRNGQENFGGSHSSYCDESLFQGISKIWRDVPYPTFFIPGDNGWLDCPQEEDNVGGLPAPERAYKLWKKYLFYFYEMNEPSLPPKTKVLRGVKKDKGKLGFVPASREARLREDRPELFSFYLEENKALVIGTSTPGNTREDSRWNNSKARRHLENDNYKWIKYNFNKYLPSVVIILAHTIKPGTNFDVAVNLEKLAQKFPAVPFLLLMDEHSFKEIRPTPNAPNLFRLWLDDTSTPTEISVDLSRYDSTNLSDVFRYDRGCYCHTDHKPTQKICWDKDSVSRKCRRKCTKLERVCGGKDVGPFLTPWHSCPDGAECCSYGENICDSSSSCSF